jgi:type I restriction enzyme, S subunit
MNSLHHTMEWFQSTVSKVVRKVIDYRGRTPLKIGMDWGNGGVLSLSANNVKQGYIDVEKDAHYGSDALYEKWMTKGDCEKGDLVFTMEAPLGNVAQIPDNKRYILSQRVILMKVALNKVTADFLAHLFRGGDFQKQIMNNSTGSTVQGIQYKKLEKIALTLPPLNQQRQIAKILTTVDSLIEKTQTLIDKYTAIKQGMMADLFTRGIDLSGTFDTNPNYGQLRPPYEQAPGLYKKTKLGWMPIDWSVFNYGNILEGIGAGKSPDCPDIKPSTGEWGVIRVSAVHPSGFKPAESKLITEEEHKISKYAVKNHDFLITRANTPELVGLVCYVENPPVNMLLSDKTLRMTLIKIYSEKYFFWQLQQPHIRRQIEIGATGTSGSMKNIGQNLIRSFVVLAPDDIEQLEIARRLDAIESNIRMYRAECEKYKRLKKGLMQDLLTGKVRVN